MSTKDSSGVIIYEVNERGHIIYGYFNGIPPNTPNKFGSGSIIVSSSGHIYSNTGTYASPNFQDMNVITGAKLTPRAGYFTVAVATNGTTPVNVFSANGAPCALTVTSVKTISQDTTAANITLTQATNTVATIAKGTSSGAVVGGVALAHTTYAQGDTCQVDSSSAGNAIVEVTFQVA